MASSTRLKIFRCHSQHEHRRASKPFNPNDSSLSNGMQFQDDQLYIADSDIYQMGNVPVEMNSKLKASYNSKLLSAAARLPYNIQKQTLKNQKSRNNSIQINLEQVKVQSNEKREEGEEQEELKNSENLSLSNQLESSQQVENSQSQKLNVQNISQQQQQILAGQIQNLLLYQSTQSKWLDNHMKTQEPLKIHSSNYLTPTQSLQQFQNPSNKHEFNIISNPSQQLKRELLQQPQISIPLTLTQPLKKEKLQIQQISTDTIINGTSIIRRVNSNSFYSTHFPKKQPQMSQKSQQISIPISEVADAIHHTAKSQNHLSKQYSASDIPDKPLFQIETSISTSPGQISTSTAWRSHKFKENESNKNKISLYNNELFCSMDSMIFQQNNSNRQINAVNSSTSRNILGKKQIDSIRYISSSPNKQRCLSSDYFPNTTQRVQSQQKEKIVLSTEQSVLIDDCPSKLINNLETNRFRSEETRSCHVIGKGQINVQQDKIMEKISNNNELSQSQHQKQSEQFGRTQLELKLFKQNTFEETRKTHNLEINQGVNEQESKEDIITIGQPKQQIKRDQGLVRQRFQRQTSSIVMKGQKLPFEQKRWSASPVVNNNTDRPKTYQNNSKQLQQQQLLNSQGKLQQKNQYEKNQQTAPGSCKQQQKDCTDNKHESIFSNDFLKQIMKMRISNMPLNQLCGKNRQ